MARKPIVLARPGTESSLSAGGAGARPLPEAREPRFWRSVLRRLRWRDRRFYPLFDMHAQLCHEAVDALVRLLSDLDDPHGLVRQIEAVEKRADLIVREVQATVRRTLIRPQRRAAIVNLVNRLDDIIDLTEDAAQSVHLYHVTAVTPEAGRLAQLALDAVARIREAVALLARPDGGRAILALCAQVDELEAQADHVLRSAMSRLFREEPDARELIKLRAVYEVLEELTDVCKDVAAELEAIVLGVLGA